MNEASVSETVDAGDFQLGEDQLDGMMNDIADNFLTTRATGTSLSDFMDFQQAYQQQIAAPVPQPPVAPLAAASGGGGCSSMFRSSGSSQPAPQPPAMPAMPHASPMVVPPFLHVSRHAHEAAPPAAPAGRGRRNNSASTPSRLAAPGADAGGSPPGANQTGEQPARQYVWPAEVYGRTRRRHHRQLLELRER